MLLLCWLGDIIRIGILLLLYLFFNFSPTDNKISDLEAELEEKNKQGKLPAVSEEGSPGDSLVIRKRKRREPGEWWVSSSRRAEETDVTDSPTTAKKSKQNKEEPKTLRLPASTKKDGAAKRRTQKQPAQSPVRKTKTQTLKKRKKAKGDKQDNNLNFEDSAPGRRKLFDEVEVEQSEQQGVMDEDPGPLHSSPLPLPERDRSLNSSKKNTKLHDTWNQIPMFILFTNNIHIIADFVLQGCL